MVLSKGTQKKYQNNPAALFNAIQKILQSCYFGYFAHIYLKKSFKNSEFSQRSACIQNIKAIEHTIPSKLQISNSGCLGHVQAHLPKTGKFFEVFDEGLSACKKLKQFINPFL